MTRRVNQFSPRWWKTERIQHSQDLNPVTKYPDSMGVGTGKGLELWSSTKAYAKDDVVFFNSPDVKGIFVANEAIPASGFLNIGVDGPTWSVVGDEFASIPNWYSMEWPANSVVVRAGALRRAIANTSATWVDSEWDNLTPAPVAADTETLFENHDAAKSYKKDQVVVVSGKLYRARTNVGALPFSLSDWEEVSPASASGLTEVQIFDFDTVETYKANELCVLNDKLYRAINNTGPGTFVTSDWKEVSAALSPWVSDIYPAGYMTTHKNKIWKAAIAATISDEPGAAPTVWRELAPTRVVADNFSATREYVKNELVVNGGKLYRAKDIVGPAAWDEANFEALGDSGGIATWESTKDYAIDTEVRWDQTTYKATEAITQGGTAPDVNGKWAAVNKASAIAKLVPGETVAIGALRMYNNLGLMANAAHAVANPVDNVELEKWDLAIGKMGNATYTAKVYIGAGTAIDFTLTANWTKAGAISLPSTDNFLFWKNKGARFYLNGQPLAAAAVSFVEKGFTINGYYVEVGDVVSVEF